MEQERCASSSPESGVSRLRRSSERRWWMWDGVAATRSSLFQQLDLLSSSVTIGFGDIKTTKSTLRQRALPQSTWRLLDSWHHEAQTVLKLE